MRAPTLPPDQTIRSFWDWFAAIAAELASNYSDRELLSALGEQVSSLGEIKWEVGPGENGRLAFAISPDGDKDWLTVTRYIIKLAPVIAGWDVLCARPPKRWDLRFSIEREGRHVKYDARPWRYVLYEFPDLTFDVVVEQNNVAAADATAAMIVLDGILGEEERISRFGAVEAVSTLSLDLASKATPIGSLAAHMHSLLRSPA